MISDYCLTHAGRKVYELIEHYPGECGVVLDVVTKVYEYEAETEGMSPEDRLAYHQSISGPVMKELKEWIEKQFAQRLRKAMGLQASRMRSCGTSWIIVCRLAGGRRRAG